MQMIATRNTNRLEIKSLDESAGTFVGYCSVFGNEDQGGDIVAKGAFAKCLAERGPRGVKMLYEHDPCQPIGIWDDLQEDDYGLLGKGRLLLDLQKGREVFALMKAQALDGLSIGYRVTRSTQDRAKPHIRLLQELDLREVSAVMFPMNEECVIGSVKAHLPSEREFQRWLQRDAGLTRAEAEHVISHGLKSLLKAQRDAGGEVASTEPPDAGLRSIADSLRRLTADIR